MCSSRSLQVFLTRFPKFGRDNQKYMTIEEKYIWNSKHLTLPIIIVAQRVLTEVRSEPFLQAAS